MLVSNLAAMGAVYVALSPRISTRLYTGMLFHPAKYPLGNYLIDAIDGVARQEVFFPTASDKKLHGWYFLNPTARKTVLYHHGNAGNLTYRMGTTRMLLAAGASVFLYDYQGYGLSEGRPSLKGICDDGRFAFDYLVNEEGLSADDIICYGESLGAGVACEAARTRNCAGLILQSAFCSLHHIGREVLPLVRIYPQWLFPEPRLDNLAYLQGTHPPVLILHGQLDSLVPFAHAQELYSVAAEPKVFVPLPLAGHNDLCTAEPEKFARALGQFLAAFA